MLDCSMETEQGVDGGQRQAASNRGQAPIISHG